MGTIQSVNDLVIRFANVNGTGSASANNMFAKSIFRMGIPVTPKNIFPSNIQGLPTWYEVRISEKGQLGRRDGVDVMVCVNPQSMAEDVESVLPGGYFIFDNTKHLHPQFIREDIHYLGIPMIEIAMNHFSDPRQRQLFKNVIYVGALSALLDIEMEVLKGIVEDQFRKKEKLIAPNHKALDLGYEYAMEHFDCPLSIRVERRDLVNEKIIINGNTACALGALYGGATVVSWYPITPSTSLVDAFEQYAKQFRIDPETGKKRYAVIQAEDELAAMGMVIGATWNGSRAFTATSGPGLSLMSEFIGLAYFAEIPVVLVNVQRGGPSTGMPTRTQQSDILSAASASHGDTRHVLLFPSNPKECFELTAEAFDLADRLQTPVIVMSDLDLGMNDHLSPALSWDDKKKYDLGKVLTAKELDDLDEYGRYLDVDDDGIPYRTLPGTHPTKGAFFTRGTSKDDYARYTEKGDAYVRNMERLEKKMRTAREIIPAPEYYQEKSSNKSGVLFYGTTAYAALEALESLSEQGTHFDAIRLRSYPFSEDVKGFIESHDRVFVVEQNRDAQLRTLLIKDLEVLPDKLIPVLNFDGMPITANRIEELIQEALPGSIVPESVEATGA